MTPPHGGYAGWYVDALSDDCDHGITVIAFLGSVFSPYYAWARRRGRSDPLWHCAMNVALYGSRRRWAMTERSATAVQRGADFLAIGPNALEWDRSTLTIRIDEIAVPFPPEPADPRAEQDDAPGSARMPDRVGVESSLRLVVSLS